MNTIDLERIITHNCLTPRVKFLGVFPRDHTKFLVAHTLDAHTFPLCFVSNTKPSTSRGEHWVAFYYTSEHSAEFFDSYGLHPSLYDFHLQPIHSSIVWNQRCLQQLNSNVCGQYCIYYLYQRIRAHKSLRECVSSFSLNDRAWNDSSVSHFVSRLNNNNDKI